MFTDSGRLEPTFRLSVLVAGAEAAVKGSKRDETRVSCPSFLSNASFVACIWLASDGGK